MSPMAASSAFSLAAGVVGCAATDFEGVLDLLAFIGFGDWPRGPSCSRAEGFLQRKSCGGKPIGGFDQSSQWYSKNEGSV